jgi:hypothetical protein
MDFLKTYSQVLRVEAQIRHFRFESISLIQIPNSTVAYAVSYRPVSARAMQLTRSARSCG